MTVDDPGSIAATSTTVAWAAGKSVYTATTK
jgi:hypothetical protein